MSDVIGSTIKLMDEADLFFRDYNTINLIRRRAKKSISGYDSYLFDSDLVKKINEIVEDKFGEGTRLL